MTDTPITPFEGTPDAALGVSERNAALPEDELDDVTTMTVVTTALGTLSEAGIVAVETEAVIPVALYSPNWMRPKTARDARKAPKLVKTRIVSSPAIVMTTESIDVATGEITSKSVVATPTAVAQAKATTPKTTTSA